MANSNSELPMRRTVVTRSIVMKVNPAMYETFDIGVSLQQEIDWQTKEELWDKTKAFNVYANADFEQFLKTTLEKTGLASIQGTTDRILNGSIKEGSSNSAQNAKNKDDFDQLD